ncbi:unnamed protein product [Tetraodon nigroviridis]|uniref:(spotted green pufferfish) hypothetical protein n=1 Tax=Tetraodon nigroviridis TaxID=99883 RepID=Q4SUD5_TETNG|nr:unnamed protein product [Tetraodon nigroviridis]
MMYQYFVKIVPTIYVKTDGEVSSGGPLIIWFGILSDYFKRRVVPGVENQPVFSYQARESGQRPDRGPGAAGRVCPVRVIADDGQVHREAQVVHALLDGGLCHHRRGFHSGWSDRLPHLPLCQSHPEEDRAGQGLLTEPPLGGSGRSVGRQTGAARGRVLCLSAHPVDQPLDLSEVSVFY